MPRPEKNANTVPLGEKRSTSRHLGAKPSAPTAPSKPKEWPFKDLHMKPEDFPDPTTMKITFQNLQDHACATPKVIGCH